MKAIIKLATAATLLIFVQGALAVQEISSCHTDITVSGSYVVTQDLANTSGDDCIDITADNVTLDCQGYRLKGTGTDRGIHAYLFGLAGGVVVRNCDIYDFADGIHLRNANNSLIEYNKVVDNEHGIYLWYTDGTIVQWNKGDDNENGLYLQSSNDNHIYESTWHGSEVRGVYCSGGLRNEFVENQVNHNGQYGMYFSNCDNGDIWYNTANQNETGIWLAPSSTGNDLYKNVFNRNDDYGINDAEGPDTTNFYDGNVCRNNGIAPSFPPNLCK